MKIHAAKISALFGPTAFKIGADRNAWVGQHCRRGTRKLEYTGRIMCFSAITGETQTSHMMRGIDEAAYVSQSCAQAFAFYLKPTGMWHFQLLT